MASKRNRPYDEPPSPESSAEEEEEIEEEEEEDEEEQQTPVQTLSKQPLQSEDEEQHDEDDEDEDEEEEEESDDDIKNPVLTPKTPSEAKTKTVTESDSETDSDVDVRSSQKTSNYTIKPVSKDSPSPSSKSKPAVSKAMTVKEKEKAVKVSKPEKAVKVQQKAVEEEEDGVEKKGAITRLWGFNDEIVVLQGLIDFKRDNNKDPGANHDEFYNFVKGKLSSSKFTKVQLMDKVRRLKKKYRTHLSKSFRGKDPEISNPHELKSFQLSKIFWGDVDGNNVANSNVHSKSHSKANVSDNAAANMVTISSYNNNNNNNHVKSSAKKIKLSEKVTHSEGDMMELDEENKRSVSKDSSSKEEEKEFGQLYPNLLKAFEGESVPRVPLLDGFKSCLGDVDSSQLEEWDRKWKEVRLAETAAYISRLALIQEQTSWFCNAMKSSKH